MYQTILTNVLNPLILYGRSHHTAYRTTLTLLLGLAALGCAEKEDIIVLGEVRDPANNCEVSLVEYEFKVKVGELTPLYWREDWCAVMGGGKRMTCFLNANNEGKNSSLDRPRRLPHKEADPSHPDLDCWADELADWDGSDDGGGGSAGESSTNDGYHPIFNNE